MNLARVIRGAAILGPLHLLILLHEIPPQLVQVLGRVLVHPLLEAQHHLAPAAEDEQLVPLDLGGGLFPDRRIVDLHAHLREPRPALAEPLELHRHALGREDVSLRPQHVRQLLRDVLARINRVPQFVEHRAHPVFVVLDVGEHADVAFAIDVRAEGVRALAALLFQIAAGEDVRDRQADAGVEVLAQFQNVRAGERGVEVRLEHRRRFLEERIEVVPRHEFVGLDRILSREPVVDVRLRRGERCLREVVEVVEQLEEFFALLLVEGEHHGVEVGEAELLGGFVAEADEFFQVRFHGLADALARFPNFLPHR